MVNVSCGFRARSRVRNNTLLLSLIINFVDDFAPYYKDTSPKEACKYLSLVYKKLS